MKTVSCILRTEPERAAGRCVPRSGTDKVVDLEAWKAEHLAAPERPEAGRVSALGQYGGREPVRRRRKSEAALNRAELAATLMVAAALAALVLRVLLF